MAAVTVRDMLDAGMHYGHHASRWNPKMRPYIYGKRNLIHIIDLRETMRGLITAQRFLTHVASGGNLALFVGAKRQAKRTVREESLRCGMPFVAERWLGGTLTNFRTIRSRLDRLFELEEIVGSPAIEEYSKKDASRMRRELAKIFRNLDGIRNMGKLPGVVVVVDPKREKNAIAEAQKLNIPTVCLADTDCDPDMADVLIPGNDDAMRSIGLVLQTLADAVIRGKEALREAQRQEAEEAATRAAEEARKKKDLAAAMAQEKAREEAVRRGAEAHRAAQRTEAPSSETTAGENKPAQAAVAEERTDEVEGKS